jgi:uncharacterized metal-binding protein
MMMKHMPACARCPYPWPERYCRGMEGGKAPKNCPTLKMKDAAIAAGEKLEVPEILEFARQASIQESQGYGGKEKGYALVKPIKPRIVETMELAEKMGWKRLGLAFCGGPTREAAVVDEIFAANGFEVASVMCKIGGSSKQEIGLDRSEQIDSSTHETMCNPVLQAEALNRAGTEFNVLLGLCVGHDSLFLMHAEAPCTVLAAKDRMHAHCPLTPVYNYDTYWRSLKSPK